jgi:hypothetical protein
MDNKQERTRIQVIDRWHDEVYGTFSSQEEAEQFVAIQLNNVGVYYIEVIDSLDNT